MIKFFRHIRKSLLEQNKMGNYFKYALGEILLVMIGILLALQVSNWNEQRKQRKSIEALLNVFEDELNTNIKSCNRFMEYGYRRDSVFNMYLDNEITKDMLRKNGARYLGFNTSMRQFIDDHLNEIIANEKQLPQAYRSLIPDLKELKRRLESRRYWEKAAIEISKERFKEMADTYPWNYKYDSISNEKRINLILNDSLYKNKIIHYHSYQLYENVWDASLIRTTSVAVLWKIMNIRKKDNPPQIDTFLNNLELTPFKKIPCNNKPYIMEDLKIDAGLNFIFYNNRSSPAEFKIVDENGNPLIDGSRTLEAKSFLLYEFGLRKNEFIQVLNQGECYNIFGKNKEDYVIID